MASCRSSSTSSVMFALHPWDWITSQGTCRSPGQGFSATLSTHHQEWWGPIGRAHVSQVSDVPKGGTVRLSYCFGTHMAFLFSFLGRWCSVGGGVQGVGCGVRDVGPGDVREGVLCWDEALYPHIFLWEWLSGSFVALPPSVASSPQWPSAFCLPSGIAGLGFALASFPFLFH